MNSSQSGLRGRRRRWAEQWPAWSEGPGADAFECNVRTVSDWLPTAGRVLDAGAGEGRLSARLAARGCDVVAVDVNEALAGAVLAGRGIRALAGDLVALPFRDAAFDTTVCFMALQEISEVGRALAELARVTRPAGRLVVSTSHPFSTLLSRATDGSLAVSRDYTARRLYRRRKTRGGLSIEFQGFQHTVRDYLGGLGQYGWQLLDFRETAWADDEQWARVPRYLQFMCTRS